MDDLKIKHKEARSDRARASSAYLISNQTAYFQLITRPSIWSLISFTQSLVNINILSSTFGTLHTSYTQSRNGLRLSDVMSPASKIFLSNTITAVLIRFFGCKTTTDVRQSLTFPSAILSSRVCCAWNVLYITQRRADRFW